MKSAVLVFSTPSVVAVVSLLAASGWVGPAAEAESAIRGVLEAQVQAWNRGDLEGYMLGYWNSPELVFQSGGAVTKGWTPTLERYRKRYQGEGREMGELSFPTLEVLVLSEDAALVRGSWHLSMSDGAEPHGLFTLLARDLPEGWRIVHDHSSSE